MTNIQSRWLDIGQALFCEANTQLSSPNKLHWFAHLSSQLEHRICFILPAHGFKHKILINNYALLTGCEVKMTEYLCLYSPCLPLARLCSKKNWRQPSTLNLWNPVCPANDFCEKAKIFWSPENKSYRCRCHGPQSTAWSWSIKMQKSMRPIFSHLDWTSLFNKIMNNIITWPRRKLLLAGPTWEIQSGQNRLISPAWVAN